MTIGEYLQQQQMFAKIGGYVGILVILFAAARYLPHNWGPYGLYAVAGGAAIIGLLSLLQHQFLRCPRCHADLATSFIRIRTGQLHSCPQCGVSSDEQV